MGAHVNPNPFQFKGLWEGFKPVDTFANRNVVDTLRQWAGNLSPLNTEQTEFVTQVGFAALMLTTAFHLKSQLIKPVLLTCTAAVIPIDPLIRHFGATKAIADECRPGDIVLAQLASSRYERVKICRQEYGNIEVFALNTAVPIQATLAQDAIVFKTSPSTSWFEIASLHGPGIIDFNDASALTLTALVVVTAAACRFKSMSKLALILGTRHLIQEHAMPWVDQAHTFIMDHLPGITRASDIKRPDFWEALFEEANLTAPEEHKKALASLLAQTYGQSREEQRASVREALDTVGASEAYYHLAEWASTYRYQAQQFAQCNAEVDADLRKHLMVVCNTLSYAIQSFDDDSSKSTNARTFDLAALCQSVSDTEDEDEQRALLEPRLGFDPEGHFWDLIEIANYEEHDTPENQRAAWHIIDSWIDRQPAFQVLPEDLDWDKCAAIACCVTSWQQTPEGERAVLAAAMKAHGQTYDAIAQIPADLAQKGDNLDENLVQDMLALRSAVIETDDME